MFHTLIWNAVVFIHAESCAQPLFHESSTEIVWLVPLFHPTAHLQVVLAHASQGGSHHNRAGARHHQQQPTHAQQQLGCHRHRIASLHKDIPRTTTCFRTVSRRHILIREPNLLKVRTCQSQSFFYVLEVLFQPHGRRQPSKRTTTGARGYVGCKRMWLLVARVIHG